MPETDEAHFTAIPWCQPLLSDPKWAIVPTRFRFVKPSGEDRFFGRTVNTASAMSAALSQCRTPTTDDPDVRELRTFVTLGPCLDGYPGVCHGGIQAALLDEVMGLLLLEIKDQKPDRTQKTGQSGERMDGVTVELNMKYLKPVATPGTYCVIVRLAEHRGRKYVVDGTIENSKGTTLVKASGLFIDIPNQKL